MPGHSQNCNPVPHPREPLPCSSLDEVLNAKPHLANLAAAQPAVLPQLQHHCRGGRKRQDRHEGGSSQCISAPGATVCLPQRGEHDGKPRKPALGTAAGPAGGRSLDAHSCVLGRAGTFSRGVLGRLWTKVQLHHLVVLRGRHAPRRRLNRTAGRQYSVQRTKLWQPRRCTARDATARLTHAGTSHAALTCTQPWRLAFTGGSSLCCSPQRTTPLLQQQKGETIENWTSSAAAGRGHM